MAASPHITRFSAENIKKLRVVNIAPSGRVVTISGANGSGKSSVLDAIAFALLGGRAIDEQPIRQGETSATVKLAFGDVTITRRFTPSGTTLKIETAEGAEFKSPQSILDGLLGDSVLNFDPMAFERMKPADQVAELEKVAPMPAEVRGWKREIVEAFTERTAVAREVKALGARIQATPVPEPIPPHRTVSELIDELAKVAEVNAANERERTGRELEAGRIGAGREAAHTRIAEAEDMIRRARQELESLDKRAEMLAGIPAVPADMDAEALRGELAESRILEGRVREAQALVALDAEFTAKSTEVDRLTKLIEDRDTAIRGALAEAPMPIPGLNYAIGHEDGGLLFNGLPFIQASQAQRIRVALALAMAKQSKVRIVRITDGALLDEHSLAAIAEMAEARDYQVWIEVVDTSGKLGIVMVDGEVQGATDGE